MATSANFLSIFLLFLVYYLQVQVQGRESKFFSKFSTQNTTNNNSLINTTAPTNAITTKNNNTAKDTKQEEPISFKVDTHNGYGLYGHGSSEQFSPATTSRNDAQDTYIGRPNQTPGLEYPGASYDEFKELNEAYSNNNGFETEQQGMSDTRFIKNGKYFYDVDTMNSYSNENPSMNVNDDGFGSSGGAEFNSARYYNENAPDGEFNNYMEESQMNQEELQESQEEYVP